MEVTVTVDAKTALAHFSPAGIPEGIRRQLRSVIPGLTRRLGALVERRLESELKSRRRLTVQKQMIENRTMIVGRVSVKWTGDPRSAMVPAVLDTGAKAHVIAAKNGKALAFFWPKMGRNVLFKQVHHPGFAGIFYAQRSLADMSGEIEQAINSAVRDGARR